MEACVRGLVGGLIVSMMASAAMEAPVSGWAAPQVAEMDAVGLGQPVVGMTFEGAVPKGQEGSFTLIVPATGTYALSARCGEDCADIGLIVEHGGQEIAAGVSGVKVALQAGAYTVKVGFDQCGQAQCRYVVRGYRKGS